MSGIETTVSAAAAESRPAKRRRASRVGIGGWLAIAWLALIVFGAIFANVLPLPSATKVAPQFRLLPLGSPGHILGTDNLGRDLLARMVLGARVSLIVAVASLFIGTLVGVPLGMLAGYFRKYIDAVVMLFVDVVLAFPSLILVIGLVAFLGQNLQVISLALGLLAIPPYARLARAITIGVAARDFVLAAQARGTRDFRILTYEILPNLVPALLAYSMIAMGVVIVVEGSLSFLGLSVAAPQPSWGGLIAEGRAYMYQSVNMVLVGSGALFLTVIALNYLGDVIRRAFDVREARI
jgi:peptide/nickel transport system permease protein